MSTWHQDRAPVVLYHPELWTLVEDSPGRMTSVSRYRDPIEAQRACDALNAKHGQCAYVLPPQKDKT